MYNGVIIADVHNGASPSIHEELNDVFIYHLRNMMKLDFIIIAGDYYDRKLFLNDPISNHAVDDMKTICEIAKEKKAKIRIIYGTDSHDSNQYSIFDAFRLDEDLDMRIIYKVEEEDLFPDCKVLYIPEEHIYSKEEVYGKYFEEKNKYDFIFGHGVINEVMTYTKIDDTKSNKLKVPVWKSSELEYICKGLVMFGHYHIYSNINNKVFYIGSYSRWKFGEEIDKGFMEICKNDDDTYGYKFIINYKAKTYKTFYFKQNNEIYINDETLNHELLKIEKLLEANIYDYIKLIFDIPINYKNTNFFTEFIKNKYNLNNRIKIEINLLEKKKADEETNEKIEEMVSDYQCIFDKSISKSYKISYFIKHNYDRVISPEKIEYYLSRDISIKS